MNIFNFPCFISDQVHSSASPPVKMSIEASMLQV